MSSGVDIRVVEAVQVIRLVRPEKKNALTGAMYAAMADALECGDADGAIAVHAFFGSNGVFSAGSDINEFLVTARSGALGAEVVRFLQVLPRLAKPLVAGVDGAAIGIGTTLLLHCDLVYASPEAALATPFLDLGLVPEAGSSLLMPQRMGHVLAFEMLVLGEPFTAERAREVGLVNAIVPAAELEEVTMRAARRLAAKPREALLAARRLLRGDPALVLDRIEEENALFRSRLSSPEAAAAFEAFLERRAPGGGPKL